MGDIATIEHHRSPIGDRHPGDGLEQGRLARPIGPEQRDHLALSHVKVYAEQHPHVSVRDLHPTDAE